MEINEKDIEEIEETTLELRRIMDDIAQRVDVTKPNNKLSHPDLIEKVFYEAYEKTCVKYEAFIKKIKSEMMKEATVDTLKEIKDGAD